MGNSVFRMRNAECGVRNEVQLPEVILDHGPNYFPDGYSGTGWTTLGC